MWDRKVSSCEFLGKKGVVLGRGGSGCKELGFLQFLKADPENLWLSNYALNLSV